jgi:hypothetical protein
VEERKEARRRMEVRRRKRRGSVEEGGWRMEVYKMVVEVGDGRSF